MDKMTLSPQFSLSHSGACCRYSSQNHKQSKQKLHEAESRCVLPKLRGGPKTGVGCETLGAGSYGGGKRSERSLRSTAGQERVCHREAGPGLPLRPAPRFPVPLLPWGWGRALYATSASRQGRSPSPCAWRLRGAGRGAWRGPGRRLRLPSVLPPSLPRPLPLLLLCVRRRRRSAMSAAKHRGSKGGSPLAANEKSAQLGGGEEPPAKKPAAAGHGRGGRAGGGGRSGAGPRRGWAMLLGAAVVLGAALPAGWYVLQLQEEVGRSAREVEASGRQRQELAATLDTVVQKVAGRRAPLGTGGLGTAGRSVLLGGAGSSSRPRRGTGAGIRPLNKELGSCRVACLAGKRTLPSPPLPCSLKDAFMALEGQMESGSRYSLCLQTSPRSSEKSLPCSVEMGGTGPRGGGPSPRFAFPGPVREAILWNAARTLH